MHTLLIVALCVLAVGLALALLVARWSQPIPTTINLTTQAIAYSCLTVYAAVHSERYAARGDALGTTAAALVAFLMFGLAAFRAVALWVWLTGRADET